MPPPQPADADMQAAPDPKDPIPSRAQQDAVVAKHNEKKQKKTVDHWKVVDASRELPGNLDKDMLDT